ncbi:glycosyltransferase, partial [bacterium]|nr:glycosyltransferase [bacterium]
MAENDLVAGMVARLDQVKDHPMLLRAFRIVAEKLPLAKLLVIGDGSIRPQLEKLAGELGLGGRVRFLGSRPDVPDLLSCMDVMVLSS